MGVALIGALGKGYAGRENGGAHGLLKKPERLCVGELSSDFLPLLFLLSVLFFFLVVKNIYIYIYIYGCDAGLNGVARFSRKNFSTNTRARGIV